jgi:hypothetical protein
MVTSGPALAVGVGNAGMVTVETEKQPFASLTVTVARPVGSFTAVAVVSPLLHKKVYGKVPPFPTAVPCPVAAPTHEPLKFGIAEVIIAGILLFVEVSRNFVTKASTGFPLLST